MKLWTRLFAVLAVTLMVVPAGAADKAAKPRKPGLRAELVKVEGTKLVVKVAKKGESDKEMTIATDDKTEVKLLDGKLGKLSDLKPGTRLIITPETGMAVSIQERKEKEKK